MSLEGNLTAFGLSEILQLIAVQQKSGMLAIMSQERARVLFFRDGHIISTRDRRRKTRDPLKDYLTRYGILSRDDLMRLTQVSQQSKLDLTEIIVSEGLMDEEAMRLHFRNHIQEEVHEILTWEQCSYKFIPGNDIIAGIKSWGDHSIEGMLMESMRRIDEFPQALKLLPDLATRVWRDGKPSDDKPLTSNETTMLRLLNKERTLSYLIGHAKIPKYETYEALRHLHEKQLVKIEAGETLEHFDSESRGRSKKRRRGPVKSVVPLLAACAVFLVALFWGVKNTIPQLKDMTIRSGTPAIQSSIARDRAENRLRWMLESYYARHGRYPATLAQLAKAGLSDESFLRKVESHSLRYRLTADGQRYRLL